MSKWCFTIVKKKQYTRVQLGLHHTLYTGTSRCLLYYIQIYSWYKYIKEFMSKKTKTRPALISFFFFFAKYIYIYNKNAKLACLHKRGAGVHTEKSSTMFSILITWKLSLWDITELNRKYLPLSYKKQNPLLPMQTTKFIGPQWSQTQHTDS